MRGRGDGSGGLGTALLRSYEVVMVFERWRWGVRDGFGSEVELGCDKECW